jgi:hypothetical protein
MSTHRSSARSRLRRFWYHLRGERAILTTFWPQDYRRRELYMLGSQGFQITRYLRAADPGFYEVWGRPTLTTPPARLRHQLRAATLSKG